MLRSILTITTTNVPNGGSPRKNSSRVQESFLKDLLIKLSTFRGTDHFGLSI